MDLQRVALEKSGCGKIFTDVASGAISNRRGLQDAIEYIRQGDILVVWRLDRLGRSLQHLLEVIKELEQRGIGFRSLSESLDTTTSGGKLVFQMCSVKTLIKFLKLFSNVFWILRIRFGNRPGRRAAVVILCKGLPKIIENEWRKEWESNPPYVLYTRIYGFEVRGAHQWPILFLIINSPKAQLLHL